MTNYQKIMTKISGLIC